MSIPDIEKHRQRLRYADAVAHNSPDPSSKVGAVLFNQFGMSCANGWNSFPARSTADKALYHDRPSKYDRVIHAEMRCLIGARTDCHQGSLYTSCPPCKDCAKHICEANIARVYFFEDRMEHDFVQRNPDNIKTALIIFQECDVQVIRIPVV